MGETAGWKHGIKRRGKHYWIRYSRNGRRFEENTRSKSWTVASNKLNEREGLIAKGANVTPAMSRLTFADAALGFEGRLHNEREAVLRGGGTARGRAPDAVFRPSPHG